MSIFVIGLNHKTASVDLREQLYFPTEKLPLYLQELLNLGHATEAVLLSTCNRSELYFLADQPEGARDWFYGQTSLSTSILDNMTYLYEDQAAVAHIMTVSCGLDSMVLGEPQILGQMKTAFLESCSISAVGSTFHRLFQQVFATAKMIRTVTAIGACPVSVASAALRFVAEKYALAQSNIVVIGAGETSALLLKYLKANVVGSISVVNRTLENASQLIDNFQGQIFGLHNLKQALKDADLVFSATGSATPVITPAVIQEVLALRRRVQALCLIDIAVPRDIDPQVGELKQVKLYCIDDLKKMITTNYQGREHAAIKAQEMISSHSRDFMIELESIDRVSHTIRAYRGQIEAIGHAELIKAKQRLRQGADPHLVLDAFVHAFTKKLLHAPSVQLRQAGVEGRFELLRLAKQLFAIPDTETECI